MREFVVTVVLAAVFILGCDAQTTPTVNIEVVLPIPDPTLSIQSTKNHLYAYKDRTIILDCTVDNKPKGTLVKWSFYPKGSLNLIPISYNLQSYDDSKWKVEAGVAKSNSYRLSILAPSVKSEGRYQCQAEYDDNATPVEESIYVEIISKPIISASKSSTDIKAKPGENVELQCFADGIPKPVITWRRAGKAYLPTGGEFHTQPSMTIQNIQPKHQGVYICEAKNKAGIDTLKINIRLNFAPRITADKEVYQKIGYKKDLICMIVANPIPKENQVSWSKDGQVFTTGGRFKVGYTYGTTSVESYLSILSVQKEDFGTYTCLATADGNTRTAQITLTEVDKATPDKRGLIVAAASCPSISMVTAIWCLFVAAVLVNGR